MEALGSSVLAARIGESGQATLVTVAPARRSEWSTRVIAAMREFRHEPLRERVLLVLPVGRSPPRGAILDATVRVEEPRPKSDGFDERAWLARQGIHVVLDASSWRQIGRRGGLQGWGDRLRDRIELAIGRGASGVRRGIVLGVVLGEDEGLPADVQRDFRASGLYHLLRVDKKTIRRYGPVFMRLDAYIRVSRVGGREGDSFISPDIQRDRINAYATSQGFEIGRVFEELDVSGAKQDRPLFEEALRRAEQGDSDGVIVYAASRFGRSLIDALA